VRPSRVTLIPSYLRMLCAEDISGLASDCKNWNTRFNKEARLRGRIEKALVKSEEKLTRTKNKLERLEQKYEDNEDRLERANESLKATVKLKNTILRLRSQLRIMERKLVEKNAAEERMRSEMASPMKIRLNNKTLSIEDGRRIASQLSSDNDTPVNPLLSDTLTEPRGPECDSQSDKSTGYPSRLEDMPEVGIDTKDVVSTAEGVGTPSSPPSGVEITHPFAISSREAKRKQKRVRGHKRMVSRDDNDMLASLDIKGKKKEDDEVVMRLPQELKSISIPESQVIEGVVHYHIVVTVRKGRRQQRWSVLRRYRDFDSMNTTIRAQLSSNVNIPEDLVLPRKYVKLFFSHTNETFVEQRRVANISVFPLLT